MFSQACVILSTGGGGRVSLIPGPFLVPGPIFFWAGVGVGYLEGRVSGGRVSGGRVSGGGGGVRYPSGRVSGWYASYWNAFLLLSLLRQYTQTLSGIYTTSGTRSVGDS